MVENESRPDSRSSRELNLRPGEGQGGSNNVHLDPTIRQNIQKEKIIEHHIEGHKTARKIGLEFVHITKTGGSAIEKAGSQIGIIWGACHFMDNVPEVGCFGKPDIEWEDPPYFPMY